MITGDLVGLVTFFLVDFRFGLLLVRKDDADIIDGVDSACRGVVDVDANSLGDEDKGSLFFLVLLLLLLLLLVSAKFDVDLLLVLFMVAVSDVAGFRAGGIARNYYTYIKKSCIKYKLISY